RHDRLPIDRGLLYLHGVRGQDDLIAEERQVRDPVRPAVARAGVEARRHREVIPRRPEPTQVRVDRADGVMAALLAELLHEVERRRGLDDRVLPVARVGWGVGNEGRVEQRQPDAAAAGLPQREGVAVTRPWL